MVLGDASEVSIDIRPAGAADARALGELQWQWRIDEWHGTPQFDRDEFADALDTWRQTHYESHEAFVGRLNGEVVAMGWLAILERVPTPTQFRRLGGHIQSVYVIPDVRDRGVGGLMIRRLIDRARELGLGWVLVHPSERSFSFYRKYGFVPTGRFLELRLTLA